MKRVVALVVSFVGCAFAQATAGEPERRLTPAGVTALEAQRDNGCGAGLFHSLVPKEAEAIKATGRAVRRAEALLVGRQRLMGSDVYSYAGRLAGSQVDLVAYDGGEEGVGWVLVDQRAGILHTPTLPLMSPDGRWFASLRPWDKPDGGLDIHERVKAAWVKRFSVAMNAPCGGRWIGGTFQFQAEGQAWRLDRTPGDVSRWRLSSPVKD